MSNGDTLRVLELRPKTNYDAKLFKLKTGKAPLNVNVVCNIFVPRRLLFLTIIVVNRLDTAFQAGASAVRKKCACVHGVPVAGRAVQERPTPGIAVELSDATSRLGP